MKFKQLTKKDYALSSVLMIFDGVSEEHFTDGKARNTAYLEVGSCQGHVLQNTYKPSRYALVVPTLVYNTSDLGEVTILYQQWAEFIKLFNPRVKLHLPSEQNLGDTLAIDFDLPCKTPYNGVHGIAHPYNQAVNGKSDPYLQAFATLLEIPTLYSTSELLKKDNNFFIFEIPNDTLASFTLTITRYLSRTLYNRIPQFVLELYQDYNVPPVAALYLGHYIAGKMFRAKPDKVQEALANLSKFADYPFSVESSREVATDYVNYYGLFFPSVLNAEKLHKLTIDQFLKKVRSSKTINGILLDQEQLIKDCYSSNYQIGTTCNPGFLGAVLQRGSSATNEFFTKLVNPVLALNEAAHGPVAEFLTKVETISKEVYG
jgi:hypothetical protein